jgi:hypothetical protein
MKIRTYAFIYALKDPDSLAIRYVGKSVDPEQRYKFHLNMRGGLVGDWIDMLKKRHQQPTLCVLEKVAIDEAEDREQWWIDHLVSEGCRLLNLMKMGLPLRLIRTSRRAYRRTKDLLSEDCATTE